MSAKLGIKNGEAGLHKTLNIPEIMDQLLALYEQMSKDPVLAGPAMHVHFARDELMEIQNVAWSVWHEKSANPHATEPPDESAGAYASLSCLAAPPSKQ